MQSRNFGKRCFINFLFTEKMHEPENVAVKGHPEIRVEFVVKSFSFIGKKNFRCETVIRAQAIVNFMCNLGIINRMIMYGNCLLSGMYTV